MAYGVQTVNDFVLPSTSQSENTTQLDTLIFTDLISTPSPSTTSPASGGVWFGAVGTGSSITSNSTTAFTAFGIGNANGTVTLATGTTNNATGYGALQTSLAILPGIPTPSSGLVTKYEAECLIRTESTIHSNTVRGYYRFGFMDLMQSTTDGVYLEFICNGTLTDTTWNVVFRKDNSQERVDTTVTVSASKTYRLYLCVEVNSSGTYTTTYKVKNVTDNTGVESTAAPSNAATYYPAASGDYMGAALVSSKTVTATTTSISLYADYVAARIRRPVSREILIYT